MFLMLDYTGFGWESWIITIKGNVVSFLFYINLVTIFDNHNFFKYFFLNKCFTKIFPLTEIFEPDRQMKNGQDPAQKPQRIEEAISKISLNIKFHKELMQARIHLISFPAIILHLKPP